jgi:RNA polymerase sigma factor (sigma-70 family)
VRSGWFPSEERNRSRPRGVGSFDEAHALANDPPALVRVSAGEALVASSAPQSVSERVNSRQELSEPDEAGLVAAAKAGDQHAYGRLLERHQAVAFRAAYLITGSRSDAEDATQEACLKAWLALGRFRAGHSFRPWLVAIAINEARNRRRGSGRRAGLALRLAASPTPSSAVSPEVDVLAAYERERLLAGVAALSEAHQLVIAARYFLALSEAEAATALGLRRGTVKSRLARALQRLRTRLEENP